MPTPPIISNKDSNNNQSPKKSNEFAAPPPIPPKIYSKINETPNNQTNQTNQASVSERMQIFDQKKNEEKNIEKIKRNKKKVPRITEHDARQILETMVTPGDPHDKYVLKDKLGSG